MKTSKKKPTFLELIFYYGIEIKDNEEFKIGVATPLYTALYYYYLKRFEEDPGIKKDLFKNIDRILLQHRGMHYILKNIDGKEK